MAVNVLDPAFHFKTTITSDSPCHADYSAENLGLASSKGFISASFKKPPVTICITFDDPPAIDLEKIVFRPRILSQCSTGITLSFLRLTKAGRWTFWMRGEWDPEVDFVVIETMNYHPHDILPKDICRGFRPLPTSRIKLLSLPRQNGSSEISALAITISHTKQSTSAAMKNLQIFGQPSMKIPRAEYFAFADALKKPVLDAKIPSNSAIVPLIPRQEKPSTSRKTTIPEEFLDPLTFLIILDPVTLPSGITVDLGTLQRHETAQAEFGRNLFDPYTGKRLQYQDLRANLHLRQRIFDFLVTNRKSVLDESTESERTRITNFLHSREQAVQNETKEPSEVLFECRICRAPIDKDAVYEYPCGAKICRDCAVKRSFGNLANEACRLCRRVHSSKDVVRFSVQKAKA